MKIGGISNWYNTILTPSFELIDHFVSQVEPQIADAIQKYHAGKKTYLAVDEIVDGQRFAQEVETYGKIDSMGWDMKALFEEHFPNLQRRSALITVYSSFEYELFQLCALFQQEKNLTIAVTDLSGDGIKQAANYLEKVAELDTQLGSHEWQNVNHIRVIRNMIVHREGRLLNAEGKRPKHETNAIEKLPFIHADDVEVLLEPQFLPKAVSTFDSYFELIDGSIQKQYPRT
jgi:hypothetical protein